VSKIDANLLNELRIDDRARELEGGTPRWLWPTLGGIVALVLLAGAAWWFLAARPVPVKTAVAMAPAAGRRALCCRPPATSQRGGRPPYPHR
jgi:hypothetical protein